jgi:proteasome accessory factor B
MSYDDRPTKWDRSARFLKIARILHAHGEEGMSAADLARQVGVSKRTIYRDLEIMDQDAGIAIWGDRGRWGLDADTFLPPLGLTLPEAMAFFLSARLLAKATDELDTEIISAFTKLAAILPDVLAEQLQETVDSFAHTPADESFTRVLRTLTQAVAGRRIVHIRYEAGVYDASKGVRDVRIHPYAIEPSAHTRALYLIGHDEERDARRTFKVERIRSVSLTPETFPPHEPSVVAELREAWDIIGNEEAVLVAIRFSPEVATRVAETRWHRGQVLEPQPDGSLLWRARVPGVLEIRSWVLAWGRDAEVLEPADLRDWVARQHADAAAGYAE